MKKFIRYIGDSHGRYDLYLNLIKNCDYSIQVGDLGLDYSQLKYKNGEYKFDTTKHKFLPGNHDNLDKNSLDYCLVQPNCLGDFGLYEIPGIEPIFYVRGAWSIDHKWRQAQQSWPKNGPVTWWPEEELSVAQLEKAIEMYKQVKPAIVVTHEAPMELVQYVTNPEFCLNFGYPAGTIRTRTNMALQVMFDYHKPKIWLFGHYHQRWEDNIKGTEFVCLDMCRSRDQSTNYYDLELR